MVYRNKGVFMKIYVGIIFYFITFLHSNTNVGIHLNSYNPTQRFASYYIPFLVVPVYITGLFVMNHMSQAQVFITTMTVTSAGFHN